MHLRYYFYYAKIIKWRETQSAKVPERVFLSLRLQTDLWRSVILRLSHQPGEEAAGVLT